MTEVTRGQIKGLFFQLVQQVGGTEAAGAYLGVSNQRVSQIQSPNSPDMPTIMQVYTLEKVVGLDIVTGVLSRAATGKADEGDASSAIAEAVEASVALMHKERTNAPRREREAAAVKLLEEAGDVIDIFSRRVG